MSDPRDRDPQENIEQIIGLARGPKGDKGEQGAAGGEGGRLPRVQSRAVVVLFLLNTALIVVAYLFISHQAQVNERKWCTTLVTLDQADQRAPKPTSEFGRKLVADFHQLRGSLGCG